MVIKYSCDMCLTEGKIDLVRQFSEPFHMKTLKAMEETEFAIKIERHKKDAGRFHTLIGTFTLPSDKVVRRLPDGWMERKLRLLK